MWWIDNKKTVLFAVLFLLLGLYTGYFVGVWEAAGRAEIKIENQYLKAEVKGKQRYEKKKQEVRNLTDTELIRRYCASSVRDVPFDQCVRTVRYVE